MTSAALNRSLVDRLGPQREVVFGQGPVRQVVVVPPRSVGRPRGRSWSQRLRAVPIVRATVGMVKALRENGWRQTLVGMGWIGVSSAWVQPALEAQDEATILLVLERRTSDLIGFVEQARILVGSRPGSTGVSDDDSGLERLASSVAELHGEEWHSALMGLQRNYRRAMRVQRRLSPEALASIDQDELQTLGLLYAWVWAAATALALELHSSEYSREWFRRKAIAIGRDIYGAYRTCELAAASEPSPLPSVVLGEADRVALAIAEAQAAEVDRLEER